MIKAKEKISLKNRRKELETKYKESDFKMIKTLTSIAKKASTNKNHKFDNLIRIISDEGILIQAMGKISKKDGATTEGPKIDPQTVDAINLEIIRNISSELKSGRYIFKPIRRIYIDKINNTIASKEKINEITEIHKQGDITMDQIKQLKIRPLGIPSFKDKIVQESMRMVLNAIYEPEFTEINLNFGFRPSIGCQDAIIYIQQHAKAMDFAIEGDVKGAFDNVNHDLLIKILEQKIKDRKFLNLIKGGLKCGILFLNYYQNSNIGTVQGSILSPLLYNIYFHEFDKFIKKEFTEKIQQINNEENRTNRPINKIYNAISKKKTRLKLRQKLQEIKNYKENIGIDKNLKELTKNIKETIKKYKVLDNEQKKFPAFSKNKQLIRFCYVRYADDWIFLTNATKENVLEWKELFKNWIRDNLLLELSQEKTKITDFNKQETAKFLGFQLTKANKHRKRIVNEGKFIIKRLDISRRSKILKLRKDPEHNLKLNYKIRTTNPTPIVAWDRERVLNRLTQNGFIKKAGNSWRGKAKLPWTVLDELEIVERYNYIIRGYLEYYTPVLEYPTDTHFLIYLLQYSCIHTLARKRSCKITEIMRKFGKNILVRKKVIQKNRHQEEVTSEKTAKLLVWEDALQLIRQIIIRTRKRQKEKHSISAIQKTIDEISNVKINWRTKYKLQNHCAICGSEENIEYHHVRHIRKGKVSGFLQIMNQLNRKQIPCCRNCHRKIHRGEYDDISLDELYDEQLIII